MMVDGANELAAYRGSGDGDRMRYYVHGVAYIDERLMMMVDQAGTSNDRPYYYVQDRLYNVWAMIDRAGAIVEGWCGHPARGCSDATCDAGILPAGGLPLIRESAGRGDMDSDTDLDSSGASHIWIAPDERVVRTGPPVVPADGGKKYRPRSDESGNRIEGRDSGERVTPRQCR